MSKYVTRKTSGSFDRTRNYLLKAKISISNAALTKIANDTINELIHVSPYESFKKGWSYEIQRDNDNITLIFKNSCTSNGQNIVLLVDTGHATRSGTWVEGKHFLDEPIQKLIDKIMKHAKEEISKL